MRYAPCALLCVLCVSSERSERVCAMSLLFAP